MKLPKLKPSDLEIQNSNTRAIIIYCQERTRVTDDELAKKMGCSKRTVQRKKQFPDQFKMSDLRVLVKVLKMTTEQKAELLGV